jgi:hypothetical protein
MNEATHYRWAWACPDCKRLHALLQYEPALWQAGQQPPFRPELPLTKFECCGHIHEITRQTIQWVRRLMKRRRFSCCESQPVTALVFSLARTWLEGFLTRYPVFAVRPNGRGFPFLSSCCVARAGTTEEAGFRNGISRKQRWG